MVWCEALGWRISSMPALMWSITVVMVAGPAKQLALHPQLCAQVVDCAFASVVLSSAISCSTWQGPVGLSLFCSQRPRLAAGRPGLVLTEFSAMSHMLCHPLMTQGTAGLLANRMADIDSTADAECCQRASACVYVSPAFMAFCCSCTCPEIAGQPPLLRVPRAR